MKKILFITNLFTGIFLCISANAQRNDYISNTSSQKEKPVKEEVFPEFDQFPTEKIGAFIVPSISLSHNRMIIKSADWGYNCNKTEKPPSKWSLPFFRSKKFYSVEKNNAIDFAAFECDGKDICEFDVNSEKIGFDPAENCLKEFVMSFRCIWSEKYHEVKAIEGQRLVINCKRETNTQGK